MEEVETNFIFEKVGKAVKRELDSL